MRAYVRYFPLAAGKPWLWSRAVEPYFAWRPHAFEARTVFGARLAGDTRDILQQYVYYFGRWEPNLTHWLARRLAPGDVFVDVGANVGYFSLLASRRVGRRGRVVAIEPSPRLFEALRRGLARNRARNARALRCAVLDREGSVRLFRGTEHHSGLTTTREERGLELECEVPAAPLPALLEPEEARRARVIKIDVEGAEGAAVAGMEPLLRSGRPDLEVVVEIDAPLLARQGRAPRDLLELFSDHGFHAYHLENDYAPESYLRPGPARAPERLRATPEGVSDVVFSRRDAARL